MKKYKVTWDVKANRQIYSHEKIIEAENAKAARESFDRYWSERQAVAFNPHHAFHILVKVEKEAENHAD